METAKGSDVSSGRQPTDERESGPSSECVSSALVPSGRPAYPQLELRRTVVVVGDIVGSVIPDEHWEILEP